MRTLNVAMVGHGFMGAAHSQGWRVAPRFFDLPAAPAMHLLVGRDPGAAGAAAERWGWHEATTNWRAAVTREDVDVVDVCTPGDSHAEIAIAALEAGKHVLCEKPLANTVEEAEAMAAAAERAAARGVVAMLGHTYRRLPATTFARDLVADGRLGEIYRVQAAYLQDWLADPTAPMTWRLRKDRAGSGSLGDIGAHIIDLTQFITGVPIAEVSGTLETLVRRRPERAPSDGAPAPLAEVTVDDTAVFMARFANGVLGTFEATRFATGRKNALRVEISGSKGALAFDLERLNELQLYDATATGTERGFRTILVTEPGHPYAGAWWPPGHTLGYEHGFSHQVKDFVEAVVAGTQPAPSFADGLQVQRVLAAVERSAAEGSAWTAVG
jgi:predicted dehydrogenase